MSMFLEINANNPDQRQIDTIVNTLRNGGVIIYPTDSVYGIACDMKSKAGVEKLCKVRGVDPGKAMPSFICHDISQVSEYTKQFDNTIFRMMKRNLPGPFTFILEANNAVPRIASGKRNTIGVRIPDLNIVQSIVSTLGNPILSLSLKTTDDVVEYYNNAFDIYEEFQHQVDIVIDGGLGQLEGSTIVDCTGSEIEIVREGLQPLR